MNNMCNDIINNDNDNDNDIINDNVLLIMIIMCNILMLLMCV